VQNKFFIFLFSIFFITAKLFADSTSVALDSSLRPFTPPNQGPLGIDNTTGVALYGVAILFAVLILVLWRNSIIKRKI
jgi:hypothetical protein